MGYLQINSAHVQSFFFTIFFYYCHYLGHYDYFHYTNICYSIFYSPSISGPISSLMFSPASFSLLSHSFVPSRHPSFICFFCQHLSVIASFCITHSQCLLSGFVSDDSGVLKWTQVQSNPGAAKLSLMHAEGSSMSQRLAPRARLILDLFQNCTVEESHC